MRYFFIIPALVLSASFTAKKQPTPFQQLSVLAGGTWVMNTKKGTLCEEWKRSGNTLLTGRSYKTEGKDTSVTERVELSQAGADVFYIPVVTGQNNGKPVSFKLIEAKDGQFIFSNPEHDFPQRVAYHIISQDSLHAWIDGKINGKEIKRDFYYRRTR